MGAWRSVVSPSPVLRAVGPHQQGAANLDHGVRLYQKLCQNELPGVGLSLGFLDSMEDTSMEISRAVLSGREGEGGQQQHGGGECPADKGSTGLTVDSPGYQQSTDQT